LFIYLFNYLIIFFAKRDFVSAGCYQPTPPYLQTLKGAEKQTIGDNWSFVYIAFPPGGQRIT